ncbi:hypothetical protein [Bacillus cereus]|uniref:Uncharacterized protein n=1 Tax=Bacillus cereus TaxID=1396 RepID=A0A9X6X3Q9_BACCE|nr:hypothetical protein [Bacillus cereus]PFK26116.1 hypothetical protein COI98_03970 [Bacillus cereus]
MKKTMKNILVGIAMSAGIVMAGVNPASAEEHLFLKDSNGNPIVYGQEYYMESYEHPGYRAAYAWWDTIILEDEEHSEPIKFQKPMSQSDNPENVNIQISTGYDSTWRYLTKMPYSIWGTYSLNGYGDVDRRKAGTWVPTEPSADMNPDLKTGNYYALKNPYEYAVRHIGYPEPVILPPAFISHNGIAKNTELSTNPTLDSKAMWRFVPKK